MTDQLPDECCQKCKFYYEIEHKDWGGYCRRFPPQVFTSLRTGKSVYMDYPQTSGGYGGSISPETGPEEWCGEYKERPND